MERANRGRFGEEQAARYLQLRGYRIVERNYRCRLGEIDLIARRGGFLVFVEVKQRRDARFAEAREFVTAAKQGRILAAAQCYLAQTGSRLQPRFDVIEVYGSEGERLRFEHIVDAFGA